MTTQWMVRGVGPATEQQFRRVLTNISTIELSTVVSDVSSEVMHFTVSRSNYRNY